MLRHQLTMSPLRRPFLNPGAARTRLLHTTRRRLQAAADSKPSGSAKATSDAAAASAKPSIKQLIKKYGYSALGVYMAISAIDLPLSFLFVHSMGQDKILTWENSVREYFGYEPKAAATTTTTTTSTTTTDVTAGSTDGANVSAAVSAWLGPTFWTEFGIAYALHKSLIFVRVPLTAAITPALVKKLQKWGFNIGKKVVNKVANKVGSKAAK